MGALQGWVPPRCLQMQPQSDHLHLLLQAVRAAEAAAAASLGNEGQILLVNWRELICTYLKTYYWSVVHKP